MATTSLRLHVNGINYRVNGIPRGTSYKDVLCTIVKAKNKESGMDDSSSNSLDGMSWHSIHSDQQKSPSIRRKGNITKRSSRF